MTINNKYNLFDTVYLITDTEQLARLITGIQIRNGGMVLYNLACGTSDTWHYEGEISGERDILKAVSS